MTSPPTAMATGTVAEAMQEALAAVGASPRVHAVDLDSGEEVGLEADEPVSVASVFKIRCCSSWHARPSRVSGP